MLQDQRICKNCNKSFTISPDERTMFEKLEAPEAKICFKCRTQQHLAFWVFGKFRKGKSDLSGDSLITVLPDKPGYPVYTAKEWFSDAWDGMDHGQAYDPARPFFDQLTEVWAKVPRPHQVGRNNTDSDWCDDAWESKNSYLSRSLLECEDLMYSYRNVRIKNTSDASYNYDCERCYDITYCFNCFNTKYSFNCQNTVNGIFLIDCRNVQDSFMCWNLRNKRYCILNEQYTKEEYQAKIAAINFGSRKAIAELQKQFDNLVRDHVVHRENLNFKTFDSVGNYMSNCNRCINTFYWEESQDCFNCFRGLGNKSDIDLTGCLGAELCCNTANSIDGLYQIRTSSWLSNCRYSEYLDQCIDCEYCFGCVGLKKKKYCILNKQYSEEEYGKLRGEIVAKMKGSGIYGDFLPDSMRPSGYNVTNAQVYFPLTKEEAIAKGLPWEDVADTHLDGISPDELPDDIKDVQDTVTTQALICPQTHYRFNIAPRELAFYRMMQIPLPRLHSDARNLNRFQKLAIIDAYPYQCTYCDKSIQAYYPPEWGYQKIACEECYQREIS